MGQSWVLRGQGVDVPQGKQATVLGCSMHTLHSIDIVISIFVAGDGFAELAL